jgi:hypothetical protein
MATLPTRHVRPNARPVPTMREAAIKRIIASYRAKILRIYPTAQFAEEQLLGCSLSELGNYIESKFRDGMTWENYGARGVWSFSAVEPWKGANLSDPVEFYKRVRFDAFVPVLNTEFDGALRNLIGGKRVAPAHPILGEVAERFRPDAEES